MSCGSPLKKAKLYKEIIYNPPLPLRRSSGSNNIQALKIASDGERQLSKLFRSVSLNEIEFKLPEAMLRVENNFMKKA